MPAIVDLQTFAHVHRYRDDKVKEYLQWPRRGYQSLDLGLWDMLLARQSRFLAACSCEARIALAQIACEELARFGIANREPHHWITLAPACFVLPIGTAHTFKPQSLIAMVRQALGDIPFLAVIEAGHYRRWGPDGPSLVDHVSYHVHLSTWSATRKQIQRALTAFLAKHRNMFGRSPAHIIKIEPEQLEWKLLYALKAQIKTYRVLAMPGEDVDSETGEIIGKTWQSKDWMRTGDHVRMIKVLKDRWLDELVFGNAEGTQLARAIRYRAMKPFCAWAFRPNMTAETSGRAIPYPIVDTYRAIGTMLRRDLGRADL